MWCQLQESFIMLTEFSIIEMFCKYYGNPTGELCDRHELTYFLVFQHAYVMMYRRICDRIPASRRHLQTKYVVR